MQCSWSVLHLSMANLSGCSSWMCRWCSFYLMSNVDPAALSFSYVQKSCTQFTVLILLSIEKCVISCWCCATALPSDHLAALPQNLSYIWLVLETVIRVPALYMFLTFHVLKLVSVFHRLGCLSKESIQIHCCIELSKIWGFHSGDYKEYRFLICYAMWVL
jgi:hypothetical protein